MVKKIPEASEHARKLKKLSQQELKARKKDLEASKKSPTIKKWRDEIKQMKSGRRK